MVRIIIIFFLLFCGCALPLKVSLESNQQNIMEYKDLEDKCLVMAMTCEKFWGYNMREELAYSLIKGYSIDTFDEFTEYLKKDIFPAVRADIIDNWAGRVKERYYLLKKGGYEY